MPPIVRLATPADVPVLDLLIPASARALSQGFYSPAQIEAAITHVFGVNLQLIEDETYFLIEDGDDVVACGGWSFRDTLYGGDQRPVATEPTTVRPRTAKIRAFFVAPGQARKGLGGMLMDACAEAAAAAGFERLELMSTLPGVPFYERLGFRGLERVDDTLPDGTVLSFVRMDRSVRLQSKWTPEEHLTWYVISHYGGCMTKQEWLADRTFTTRLKAQFRNARESLESVQRRIVKEGGEPLWTTDPEALALMTHGLEPFRLAVRERILRDHPDKVVLNYCPKCGGLARTPKARQCQWCFHDWH